MRKPKIKLILSVFIFSICMMFGFAFNSEAKADVESYSDSVVIKLNETSFGTAVASDTVCIQSNYLELVSFTITDSSSNALTVGSVLGADTYNFKAVVKSKTADQKFAYSVSDGNYAGEVNLSRDQRKQSIGSYSYHLSSNSDGSDTATADAAYLVCQFTLINTATNTGIGMTLNNVTYGGPTSKTDILITGYSSAESSDAVYSVTCKKGDTPVDISKTSSETYGYGTYKFHVVLSSSAGFEATNGEYAHIIQFTNTKCRVSNIHLSSDGTDVVHVDSKYLSFDVEYTVEEPVTINKVQLDFSTKPDTFVVKTDFEKSVSIKINNEASITDGASMYKFVYYVGTTKDTANYFKKSTTYTIKAYVRAESGYVFNETDSHLDITTSLNILGNPVTITSTKAAYVKYGNENLYDDYYKEVITLAEGGDFVEVTFDYTISDTPGYHSDVKIQYYLPVVGNTVGNVTASFFTKNIPNPGSNLSMPRQNVNDSVFATNASFQPFVQGIYFGPDDAAFTYTYEPGVIDTTQNNSKYSTDSMLWYTSIDKLGYIYSSPSVPIGIDERGTPLTNDDVFAQGTYYVKFKFSLEAMTVDDYSGIYDQDKISLNDGFFEKDKDGNYVGDIYLNGVNLSLTNPNMIKYKKVLSYSEVNAGYEKFDNKVLEVVLEITVDESDTYVSQDVSDRIYLDDNRHDALSQESAECGICDNETVEDAISYIRINDFNLPKEYYSVINKWYAPDGTEMDPSDTFVLGQEYSNLIFVVLSPEFTSQGHGFAHTLTDYGNVVYTGCAGYGNRNSYELKRYSNFNRAAVGTFDAQGNFVNATSNDEAASSYNVILLYSTFICFPSAQDDYVAAACVYEQWSYASYSQLPNVGKALSTSDNYLGVVVFDKQGSALRKSEFKSYLCDENGVVLDGTNATGDDRYIQPNRLYKAKIVVTLGAGTFNNSSTLTLKGQGIDETNKQITVSSDGSTLTYLADFIPTIDSISLVYGEHRNNMASPDYYVGVTTTTGLSLDTQLEIITNQVRKVGEESNRIEVTTGDAEYRRYTIIRHKSESSSTYYNEITNCAVALRQIRNTYDYDNYVIVYPTDAETYREKYSFTDEELKVGDLLYETDPNSVSASYYIEFTKLIKFGETTFKELKDSAVNRSGNHVEYIPESLTFYDSRGNIITDLENTKVEYKTDYSVSAIFRRMDGEMFPKSEYSHGSLYVSFVIDDYSNQYATHYFRCTVGEIVDSNLVEESKRSKIDVTLAPSSTQRYAVEMEYGFFFGPPEGITSVNIKGTNVFKKNDTVSASDFKVATKDAAKYRINSFYLLKKDGDSTTYSVVDLNTALGAGKYQLVFVLYYLPHYTFYAYQEEGYNSYSNNRSFTVTSNTYNSETDAGTVYKGSENPYSAIASSVNADNDCIYSVPFTIEDDSYPAFISTEPVNDKVILEMSAVPTQGALIKTSKDSLKVYVDGAEAKDIHIQATRWYYKNEGTLTLIDVTKETTFPTSTDNTYKVEVDIIYLYGDRTFSSSNITGEGNEKKGKYQATAYLTSDFDDTNKFFELEENSYTSDFVGDTTNAGTLTLGGATKAINTNAISTENINGPELSSKFYEGYAPNLSGFTVADGVNYTIVSKGFYDANGNKVTRFTLGQSYTARFILRPNNGYYFVDAASLVTQYNSTTYTTANKVNIENFNIDSYTKYLQTVQVGDLYVEVPLTIVEATVISEVALTTTNTSYQAGTIPGATTFSTTTTGAYLSGVSFYNPTTYNIVSKLKGNTKYIIYFRLDAGYGYKYADTITITFGGKSFTCTPSFTSNVVQYSQVSFGFYSFQNYERCGRFEIKTEQSTKVTKIDITGPGGFREGTLPSNANYTYTVKAYSGETEVEGITIPYKYSTNSDLYYFDYMNQGFSSYNNYYLAMFFDFPLGYEADSEMVINYNGTAMSTGSLADRYTSGVNSAADKTLCAYTQVTVYSGTLVEYKDEGGSAYSGTTLGTNNTYSFNGYSYDLPTASSDPAAKKTGYMFLGWFNNAECTGTPITSVASNDEPVSRIVYAKWQEKEVATYTGGTQTVVSGNPYVVTGTAPTTGYTVKYKVNGNWVDTAPTKAGTYDVKILRDETNESLDDNKYGYKAVEEVVSGGFIVGYTVTYDANYTEAQGTEVTGDIPTDSNKYTTHGVSVTVLSDEGPLEKSVTVGEVTTKYRLLGWNTQANETGTLYSVGDTFNITSNVTLYAVWRETITVTFHFPSGTKDYKGNTYKDIEIKTVKDKVIDFPIIESVYNVGETEKYFEGWYKTFASDEYSNKYDTRSASFTADTTVYAKLEATTGVLIEGKFVASEYSMTTNSMEVNTDDDNSSSLTMEVGSGKLSAGKTITVYFIIKTNNTPGFNTLTLNLKYDKSVFKLKDTTNFKNSIIPYGTEIVEQGITAYNVWYTTEKVGISITGNEETTEREMIVIDFYNQNSTQTSDYATNGVTKFLVKVEFELLRSDFTTAQVGGRYEFSFDAYSKGSYYKYDEGDSHATQPEIMVSTDAAVVYIRKDAAFDTSLSERTYKASKFVISDFSANYYDATNLETDTYYNGSITYGDKWYTCANSTYTEYTQDVIDCGTYYVKASAPANKEYYAISECYVDYLVTPFDLVLTVKASPDTKNYTGNDVEWALSEFYVDTTAKTYNVTSTMTTRDITSTANNIYNITEVAYENDAKPKAIGDYTVTVTVTAGSNYRLSPNTFEITVKIIKNDENKIDPDTDHPVDPNDPSTQKIGHLTSNEAGDELTKFYDNVYITFNLKADAGTVIVEYTTDDLSKDNVTPTWITFVNPTFATTAGDDGVFALTAKGSIKDVGTYYVRYYVTSSDAYGGVNVYTEGENKDKFKGPDAHVLYSAKIVISEAVLKDVSFDYSVDGKASWSDVTEITDATQNAWRVATDATKTTYGKFTLAKDVDVLTLTENKPTSYVSVGYEVDDTADTTKSITAGTSKGDDDKYKVEAIAYKLDGTTHNDNYKDSSTDTKTVYTFNFYEGLHERNATNVIEGADDYATQYRFETQNVTLPTKTVEKVTVVADPEVAGYTFSKWVVYDSTTKSTATAPTSIIITKKSSGYLTNLVGKEIGVNGTITDGTGLKLNIAVYIYSTRAAALAMGDNYIMSNTDNYVADPEQHIASITNNFTTNDTYKANSLLRVACVGTNATNTNTVVEGSTVNIYLFQVDSSTDVVNTSVTPNTSLMKNVAASKDFTAVWTLKTLTIKWDYPEDEGNPTDVEDTIEYGDYPEIPDDIPKKKTDPEDGDDPDYEYEFENWQDGTEPTPRDIDDDTPIYEEGDYKPKFRKVYIKYNITIKIYDESNNLYDTVANVRTVNGDTVTDKRIKLSSLDTIYNTYTNDHEILNTWFLLKAYYSQYNGTAFNDLYLLAGDYSSLATEDAKTKIDHQITIYAYYKFDIGLADVSGDRSVTAPEDITTYRKWIVGGYDITVVEKNKEFDTIKEDGFKLTKTVEEVEKPIVFFLERVADVNVDNTKDVRDVTTIRMAITGGYGYYINIGYNVTGSEVSTVQIDQKVSTAAGLSQSLNNEASGIALQQNIEISNPLEVSKNKTINLNNLSLTTTDSTKGISVSNGSKLTLKNGTINVPITLGAGSSVTLDTVSAEGTNVTITLASNTNLTLKASTINKLITDSSKSNINVTVDSGTVINETVELNAACDYVINGGEFKGGLICTNGTLVIKGGNFGTISGNALVAANGKAIYVTTTEGCYINKEVVANDEETPAVLDSAMIVAEGYTATVGVYREDLNVTVNFDTFDHALAVAKKNGVLTLLANTTIGKCYNIDKDVTINLNGFTLTRGNGSDALAFKVISDAVLTINGSVANSAFVGRINVGESTTSHGNLVINGGIYSVEDNTVVHVNGFSTNSNVTIKNATITSKGDNALQFSGSGKFIIETSVITGATAIYIKSGKTDIRSTSSVSKSTITANGDKAGYAYSTNGSNATGDAIVVDNCGYPGGSPKVIIAANNVITSANGNQIALYNYIEDEATVTANAHVVKVYNVVHDEATLRAAVEKANNNILLSNDITCATDGLRIVNSGIVMDLNGKTLNVSNFKVNYSSQSESPVEVANLVFTLKNGTVLSSGDYGLTVLGDTTTVNLDSVTLKGKWGGLATHGNDKAGTGVLNATSSKFYGTLTTNEADSSVGIYLPANYVCTFTNCYFEGECGMVVKAGTYTVTGNSTIVKSTGNYIAGTSYSGGSRVNGVGIAIQPTAGYAPGLSFTMNAGTITVTDTTNGKAYEVTDNTNGQYGLSISGVTNAIDINHPMPTPEPQE